MKTRILAIILLGAVLISVLSSCGRKPYRSYYDTTPNNNIPDAIGRGAFPEELTEEDRAFCEGTARELAKEVDLSTLTGFSNVQTDLSVYYAQRPDWCVMSNMNDQLSDFVWLDITDQTLSKIICSACIADINSWLLEEEN